MSRIPINHDLIHQYRQIRDVCKSDDDMDSTTHSVDTIATFDSTMTNVSSLILDWSNHSVTNNNSPARSYQTKMSLAKLKSKSPSSVDRSLRSQGWVGGHTPYGQTKPKRSWKLKNPADEVYVHYLGKN